MYMFSVPFGWSSLHSWELHLRNVFFINFQATFSHLCVAAGLKIPWLVAWEREIYEGPRALCGVGLGR